MEFSLFVSYISTVEQWVNIKVSRRLYNTFYVIKLHRVS